MFRTIQASGLALVMVATVAPMAPRGRVSAAQGPSLGDPVRLMQTVLERMTREPPTYRGDGDIRLKWEWWDGISRSYLFEKNQSVQEASVGQPNLLRPQWVFREIKVTFQDIYRLPPQADAKLVPILSFYVMLSNAPSSSFEGLSLYGKDGELKGVITRKYTVSTSDYPTTWANAGTMPRSRFTLVDALEFKDAKTGKVEIAAGNSSDAFNLKWGDIKTRIADDMSEEKATEDRRALRAAFAKGLRESIPER